MKRRDVLAGAGALAMAGCASKTEDCGPGAAGERYTWKMVTTWPPNFPGLGTGAANLAKFITRASGGRLTVRLYAAGELVPAFEVFDTVSGGTAEIGHGAAYYWKNKSPATQFFTAIPFGLNAQEMKGWLYFGGGIELYREVYDRFGLVPFPAGNTGVQMGGWFNREINSLADLQGLKMRIPGLGGEVLRRAGGTPVNLPGAEIFTALQTGTIDATEWVGPYNDIAFGLHKAANYYYYPGWQEPGPVLECIVNKAAFEALPEDLRAIVEIASSAVNDQMEAEFVARNAQALKQVRADESIEIRPFPDDVLRELRILADEVIADMAAADPLVARVAESFTAYRDSVSDWTSISEHAMLNTRTL